MPHENLDALNATRKTTHGDFEENARISQAIKDLIRGGWNHNKLTVVQLETLDMVALKISRIVSGDNMDPDHWLDLAGYSNLAYAEAVRLGSKVRPPQTDVVEKDTEYTDGNGRSWPEKKVYKLYMSRQSGPSYHAQDRAWAEYVKDRGAV